MAPEFQLGRLQHETVLPHMSGVGPFTIESPESDLESKPQGETLPRRHPAAKDGLFKTPDPAIQTVYDILKYSAEHHANKKMMGWRKVIKLHHETKLVKKQADGQSQEIEKKWTYFELSPYQYITYEDYVKLVGQIGSGLSKVGLSRKDRLHIFAGTGPNWLSMSHGAVSRSIPVVTAYDTLGEEGLRHSLLQTKSKAIFTEPDLLKRLGAVLKDTPALKVVVYNDMSVQENQKKEIQKFRSEHKHLTVLSFKELCDIGSSNMTSADPPSRDDVCCIMYTSGSTGLPKGVPIKHKAVVAAVAGISHSVGEYLGSDDKLLSYLPLAHIFEYTIEHAFMYWGMTMGYGSPKTLTDTSVRNCKGDIREFRPTLLVGVPAVWELIKKGVSAKLDAAGAVQRNIFWAAFAAKDAIISNGIPGGWIASAILDRLVFKQIKEATGGRLKLCLYGGGPISKETHRFISMAICPMLHGYGLTETCAMGAFTRPQNFTWNSLGDIPPCIEIKLVDYAEAGYFSNNTPPQGEVWIRGDPVLEEYFDNEKETREAITNDGWFKTGDVGEFDHNGHIRLIDRKKNLVKTLNGEYIALEKLEVIYRTAKVTSNVCVFAAPEYAKPVAVVVPDWRALKDIADGAGVKVDSLEEAAHNKKVQSAVLKHLQAVGKQSGLAGMEIIDGVVLVEEEWTSDNDFLTAAQKIVRKKIVDYYKDRIYAAYASS